MENCHQSWPYIPDGANACEHYLDVLDRIIQGQIDPSFVVTHTGGLEDGPNLYKKFRDRHNGCIGRLC